jgi:hypothetical protein
MPAIPIIPSLTRLGLAGVVAEAALKSRPKIKTPLRGHHFPICEDSQKWNRVRRNVILDSEVEPKIWG